MSTLKKNPINNTLEVEKLNPSKYILFKFQFLHNILKITQNYKNKSCSKTKCSTKLTKNSFSLMQSVSLNDFYIY